MSLHQIVREEARLRILEALARDASGSASSELLRADLQTWGINRGRDWVHEELRWLADLGAVTLTGADRILVATLARRGEEHLDRSRLIEGVKPPPRPEA